MKGSFIYILSFMSSFVKNEIEALQKQEINIRVIILGPANESTKRNWSFIIGGHEGLTYVYDENNAIKKILNLVQDFFILLTKGRVHYILNAFKMIQKQTYSKRLAFYHFRVGMKVFKIVVKNRPCRVHTHFAWGNAHVSAFAAELLGVPFSLTVHASDIFALNGKEKNALKWLLSKSDRAITISNFNKNYLIKEGLCKGFKIRVIHCGIPIEKFKLTMHDRRNNIFRIVTIPNGFVESKGLQVLLEAVKLFLEANVNVECLIVGAGVTDEQRREQTRYEYEVIKKGINSHVKFLGPVSQKDLIELYKNCDAFVLPCVVDSKGKKDGIPVSLMEAMAVGLPVVSTTISGIPELIEHEKQGLLATPGDVTSLSQNILRLIKDPQGAKIMARAARAKIEEEFDISMSAKKLIESLSLSTYEQR